MNMTILNTDCTTMKISTVTSLEVANKKIMELERQVSFRDFVLKNNSIKRDELIVKNTELKAMLERLQRGSDGDVV